MARLDSQVIRFKTAAETAERSEEELKTERRKMQREVFHISLKAKLYIPGIIYPIYLLLELLCNQKHDIYLYCLLVKRSNDTG